MTIDAISLAVLFVIVAAISAALIIVFSLIEKRKGRSGGESALPGEPEPKIQIDENFEREFLSILIAAFFGIIVPFVFAWAAIFKGAAADG